MECIEDSHRRDMPRYGARTSRTKSSIPCMCTPSARTFSSGRAFVPHIRRLDSGRQTASVVARALASPSEHEFLVSPARLLRYGHSCVRVGAFLLVMRL